MGRPREQFRQGDPHLPAAGERLGRFLEVRLRKTKPFENLSHPQLDAETVLAPVEVREVVIPLEEALVLAVGQPGIGQGVFDAIDFGARFKERQKGEGGLIDERASGVFEAVLRQVADGEAGRSDDEAPIGLVEPGENPQQGRLARAVWAAEADAVAVSDRPRDVVEEYPFAEGLSQAGELDHENPRGCPLSLLFWPKTAGLAPLRALAIRRCGSGREPP